MNRPTTTRTNSTTTAALISGALLIPAACGGGDDNNGADLGASPTTTPPSQQTTVATSVTAPEPTSPPTTDQVDDETWRAEVDALCSYHLTCPAIPGPGGDVASLMVSAPPNRSSTPLPIGVGKTDPRDGHGRERSDARCSSGVLRERIAR